MLVALGAGFVKTKRPARLAPTPQAGLCARAPPYPVSRPVHAYSSILCQSGLISAHRVPDDGARAFASFLKTTTSQDFRNVGRRASERVAHDLLLYTGLRRGDAVALRRQHVKNGVARLTTIYART
jgi:hypothetical protein